MTTLIETRGPQMFPTLRPAQLARMEAYGKRARVEAGEILAQSGEREGRLVVVLTGSVEILRTGLSGDERVILHGPGEFTGELSTLRGARSLVRARVHEAGEVLIIDHGGGKGQAGGYAQALRQAMDGGFW